MTPRWKPLFSIAVLIIFCSIGVTHSASTDTVHASTDTVQDVPATPAAETPASLAPILLQNVLLTPEEAAPCKIVAHERPARNAAQLFYDHGIYSTLLPVVFKKAHQGFECGRDRGMVYYFEYNDAAGREKAEHGTRAALWDGGTEATPKRPEQIFGWDRFMIVMSFKTLQKDVMGALVKKFKRFQASASSTPPPPAL